MTGSFVENINLLASKVKTIEESNEIFDEDVVPILREIANLDIGAAIADLKKGSYLGNRKIDINLLLNMKGVDEKLVEDSPELARTMWTDPNQIVHYDKATIVFTDGEVIELPFMFDGSPITISTHGDLLTQFNRLDFIQAKAQVNSIYQVNVKDNTDYAVNIDGTSYTYTSGNNTIKEAIIVGLASVINNASTPITAVATERNTKLNLIAKVPGVPFDVTVSNNLIISTEQVNRVAGYTETAFLAKLENTLAANFTEPVVGEIVRMYDILGFTSNVERVTLNAIRGNYKTQAPVYYWAKSTSALQTLSMRASDIIKIGNEIDTIMTVANNMTNVNTVASADSKLDLIVDTVIPNLTEILSADDSATVATEAAAIATAKSDEIKQVSVGSTITGAAGTGANVTYSPETGKFTFVIPKGDQGVKGDKGDAYHIDAHGLKASQSMYDNATEGFSYLALDEGCIYFKLSDTLGDWSIGIPFGKGDKGDKGDVGRSIVKTEFTATTDSSDLAGQSDATDTYTIYYDDGETDTFIVKNGKDSLSTVIDTLEFKVIVDDANYIVSVDTTDGIIEVYFNGMLLPTTEYILTDSTVTINKPVVIGDVITIKKIASVDVLDSYSQSAIDSKVLEAVAQAKSYTDLSMSTGNAATATKLQTPIKINGVSFDGSSDINLKDETDILVVEGDFIVPDDEEFEVKDLLYTGFTQDVQGQAGEYRDFAMPNPKGSWLFCDGREVSRTKYKDLFEAIGTRYGKGDGVNTFNIPDRRGLFPRTLDAGARRDMHFDRDLGSYQKDYVKQHNHYLGHWRGVFAAGGNRAGLYLEGANGEIVTTEAYPETDRAYINANYGKLEEENTVKNITVYTCIRY